MFTKALIVNTPQGDDNYYKIRIPLFEDTTGTEIIYDALCCHAPGVFGGLNIGDCVYVAFEDGKMNIPVILGRLYIREQDEYSKGYFNNLTVKENANLPKSTMFDGLSIGNLYDTVQYLSSTNYKLPIKYDTLVNNDNTHYKLNGTRGINYFYIVQDNIVHVIFNVQCVNPARWPTEKSFIGLPKPFLNGGEAIMCSLGAERTDSDSMVCAIQSDGSVQCSGGKAGEFYYGSCTYFSER